MSCMRYLPALVLPLLLAACSSVPYAERVSKQQHAYAAAAGEPVNSFRFISLYSWEALGDRQVVVYTRPTQAWLLDLGGGCPDLDIGNSLGLTSDFNRVQVGFDKVIPGRSGFPCRISQIRPIDMAKLKAARQQQRQISSEPREAAGASGQ